MAVIVVKIGVAFSLRASSTGRQGKVDFVLAHDGDGGDHAD